MPSEIDDLPLAREFPPATRADWKQLVDGVLKGAPFEKLVSENHDGLRIEPIYSRSEDAKVVAGRASSTPWQIMQRVDHPDPVAANAQALEDLENGANGLTLVFADGTGAHGFGLEPTAAALERALEGIYLDAGIGIEFQIGPQTRDMPQHFIGLLAKRNIQPANVHVRFGFDPIGAAALWGNSRHSWTETADSFARSVVNFAALGFKGPHAVADGRIVHDAGGSEAQELAFVLAVGVAYLRALENSGAGLEQARRMLYARLSADADQFMTLAKFRALRILWANVEKSCGLRPQSLFVAADTAWRMLTQRDPYVNLLRATISTFAAGLGGANSITVLPHTLALGLPDPFARRIARNTQLILLEESNLDKVTDPAAGSGGIESLTDELSKSAWSLFQDIEKAGGAFAALEQNLIQDKVAAVRATREKNIARRKDILTGASEFPNLNETPVAIVDVRPTTFRPSGEVGLKFNPLTPIRLAEPFERLRDTSDKILTTEGARPKVFLANLGTPADFTARATFAKNLFEAGGIETVGDDGNPDPAVIAASFKSSNATLVCLCSSDQLYADLAMGAVKALQAAGARHIYMAARPDAREADLRSAGVVMFIYAGCDAVATLTAAYDTLANESMGALWAMFSDRIEEPKG